MAPLFAPHFLLPIVSRSFPLSPRLSTAVASGAHHTHAHTHTHTHTLVYVRASFPPSLSLSLVSSFVRRFEILFNSLPAAHARGRTLLTGNARVCVHTCVHTCARLCRDRPTEGRGRVHVCPRRLRFPPFAHVTEEPSRPRRAAPPFPSFRSPPPPPPPPRGPARGALPGIGSRTRGLRQRAGPLAMEDTGSPEFFFFFLLSRPFEPYPITTTNGAALLALVSPLAAQALSIFPFPPGAVSRLAIRAAPVLRCRTWRVVLLTTAVVRRPSSADCAHARGVCQGVRRPPRD